MTHYCIENTHFQPLRSFQKNLPILLLNSFPELGGLLKYVRPFLNSISKAKAARLVRSLLDLFLDMEAATGQEVDLCLECIEWAKAEKRTFLRQALEVSWGFHPSVSQSASATTDFAAVVNFSHLTYYPSVCCGDSSCS